MKELFEKAKLELVYINETDVILTSGGFDGDEDDLEAALYISRKPKNTL